MFNISVQSIKKSKLTYRKHCKADMHSLPCMYFAFHSFCPNLEHWDTCKVNVIIVSSNTLLSGTCTKTYSCKHTKNQTRCRSWTTILLPHQKFGKGGIQYLVMQCIANTAQCTAIQKEKIVNRASRVRGSIKEWLCPSYCAYEVFWVAAIRNLIQNFILGAYLWFQVAELVKELRNELDQLLQEKIKNPSMDLCTCPRGSRIISLIVKLVTTQ